MSERRENALKEALRGGFVKAGGHRLEVAWHGPSPDPDTTAKTLVFLHEGLGCIAMWRDFPARLSAVLGMGALVYSRAGYGGSDPVELPRPLDYMQREGSETLPDVLEKLSLENVIMVGHSDGASIAIVAAGMSRAASRIRGCVLEAPHVFCEDVSVASIERAKIAYDQGDLRQRLARYHHQNVDCAFRGWNDAWLDPGFRAWSIEEYVRGVRCPTLVVQGDKDEYGTPVQVDKIMSGSRGYAEKRLLPEVGHSPHRDAPEAVIEATRSFVAAHC